MLQARASCCRHVPAIAGTYPLLQARTPCCRHVPPVAASEARVGCCSPHTEKRAKILQEAPGVRRGDPIFLSLSLPRESRGAPPDIPEQRGTCGLQQPDSSGAREERVFF